MHWSDFFPKLNRAPHDELITRIAPQAGIPKIIHQIYFSDKPMPSELSDNIERLKQLNPDWEHRLYDDHAMRDYIQQNYGDGVARQYARLNPIYGAALADFFRYAVLYRAGGVYLDIKSAASIPFDQVLRSDDQFILSQWRNRGDDRFRGWGLHPEIEHVQFGEFQQWNIASVPGHAYLKAVLENILRNIDVYNSGLHGTGQLGVLRVTGPIAYTLAVAPILAKHPHRIVDAESDLGLSYSIYGDEKHAGLFKDHYSQLTEPVVRLTPAKALTAAGFDLARGLWRRLKQMTAA